MPEETSPAAATAESAEPAVEVVQDEPAVTVEVEKERGRQPVSDDELAKLTSGSDDEIARANENAKKQVRGLRTAYQEQRRRAEQWSRDAATATNVVDQLYRENQTLKQNIARSENALIDQALTRANSQLENANSKYKAALQSGDADLIVAANTDVARSAAEVDRLTILKPAAAAAEREPAEQEQPAPAAPMQPRPATARIRQWVDANPWFNSNEEMTEFAMRQHKHLAIDGITEESNPDLYFRTIDERMRQQYPEKFGVTPARPPKA